MSVDDIKYCVLLILVAFLFLTVVLLSSNRQERSMTTITPATVEYVTDMCGGEVKEMRVTGADELTVFCTDNNKFAYTIPSK